LDHHQHQDQAIIPTQQLLRRKPFHLFPPTILIVVHQHQLLLTHLNVHLPVDQVATTTTPNAQPLLAQAQVDTLTAQPHLVAYLMGPLTDTTLIVSKLL
jgi:hypothetical protein